MRDRAPITTPHIDESITKKPSPSLKTPTTVAGVIYKWCPLNPTHGTHNRKQQKQQQQSTVFPSHLAPSLTLSPFSLLILTISVLFSLALSALKLSCYRPPFVPGNTSPLTLHPQAYSTHLEGVEVGTYIPV